MLQVGDIGLSVTEQRSHFALWSLMASPLLIGSDVSMRESRSDFLDIQVLSCEPTQVTEMTVAAGWDLQSRTPPSRSLATLK